MQAGRYPGDSNLRGRARPFRMTRSGALRHWQAVDALRLSTLRELDRRGSA